jgi:hypothetical protein
MTLLEKLKLLGSTAILLVMCIYIGEHIFHGPSYHRTNPSPSDSQPTTAYARGAADFDAQKAWFASQSGDRLAGANYWAANRSIRRHASCVRAAAGYSGDQQDFAAGCEDAKRWLGPIDARRADPQYRQGFNDEAARVSP